LLIGGAVAVTVVAAAVIFFGGGSSKANTFATLDIVEGKVTVTPKTGAEPHTGRKAETLLAGATVETSINTLATVTYFDGSFTRIGPGAKYHLVALERPKGGRVIIGKLDVGETFHDVKKFSGSQSRYEVQTSHAVAAVRGTKFVSRCLPPLPCGYAVIDGLVEVRSADGSLRTVHSGERVTISDSGLLSDLLLISKDDAWVNRNLFIDNGGTPPASESDATTDTSESGDSSTTTATGGEVTPAAGDLRSTTTTVNRFGTTTTTVSSFRTTTTAKPTGTTHATTASSTTTLPPSSTTAPSSTTTVRPPSSTTTVPPPSSTTTVPTTTTTQATTTTTRATTTTTHATSTTTPNPNPGAKGTSLPSPPAPSWVWVLLVGGGVAWVNRHADDYRE
jgi:hypothetical protein